MLAKKNSDPSAKVPGGCQVRIQGQGLINKSTAPIDVNSNIGKSVPAPTKCNRVFSTQVRSSAGQPCRFGNLLSDIQHPDIGLENDITPSSHPIVPLELGI